jgi:hypothetical protein
MAEKLVKIIIADILPIPAAKRVGCGMTPDSCGQYRYKGGGVTIFVIGVFQKMQKNWK